MAMFTLQPDGTGSLSNLYSELKSSTTSIAASSKYVAAASDDGAIVVYKILEDGELEFVTRFENDDSSTSATRYSCVYKK